MVSLSSADQSSFYLVLTSRKEQFLEREKKFTSLVDTIRGYGSVAVAFSGGVDSAFLLHAALTALGGEKVIVLRCLSELVSQRERNNANKILNELGVTQKQKREIELHPLIWPEFVANTPDRCYFCKKRMYQSFQHISEGTGCTVVLDGSNVDDLKSHRPGFRAIHELGIQTPLLDARLHKDEIRALAKFYSLSNHDKPSNSCLATRLPEGQPIKRTALRLVEKCEDFLLSRDFAGCRVRPGASMKNVVLELAGNNVELLVTSPVRIEIMHFFQSLGFEKVLIDLQPRG